MPQRKRESEGEQLPPISAMPSSLRELLTQEQHQNPNLDPESNPKVDPYFSSSAAVLSIISILSAHAEQLLSLPSLRDICLGPTQTPEANAHAAITNLRIGIDAVHALAASPNVGPSTIRFLRICIRLLSAVADVDRDRRRGCRSTGGVPSEHLTACGHLYLSVAYKIQMKDRASARHLLQVFHDAPYFARKSLLPSLWNYFFLRHLLHIEVWYAKEVEFISEQDIELREQRMKYLNGVYNDQMDLGTSQLALYYKEWIKVDATEAPPLPSISVPPSSVSRSLSQVVFHTTPTRGDAEVKILKSGTAIKEDRQSESGVPQRHHLQIKCTHLQKQHQLIHRSYSMKCPNKDSTRRA